MRLLVHAILGFMSVAASFGAEPIIFDTDSGFFGDDGAALVMLLRSPQRANVLGITVVPGNVWTGPGAEYMRKIAEAAGKPDTPIYLGAQAPLVHTADMAAVEHSRWGPVNYRGAFEQPFEPPPGTENAIRSLSEAIRSKPGEVTVLALGPMTNLAIALRLDPSLETKIGRIIWMGGNIRVPGNSTAAAEFNIWFDPEAAQVIFRSRIREKIMFGLDVCNKVLLRKALFDQIAAVRTPVTRLFATDMGDRYPGFHKNPEAEVSIWDALVSAYVIEPGIVKKTEPMRLDVDTRFGKTYGAVVPLEKDLAPQATPVKVVWDVDAARALELYRDLLSSK